MVFGILVLIFSLFYFGRYAKKNFNKMIEQNNKINDVSIDSNNEEYFGTEETRDTLSNQPNIA